MNCIYLRLFWYFVDIIFMSTDNQFVNCLQCFYWSAVAHNWILKSELLWSWLKLRASLQFARFVISNGRLRKFNFGLIKWPPLEVNRLNMILYTYKKKEIRLYMPDRLNIIENVGNSLNWMVMSPKRICGPGVRVYTFQIFF